MIAHMRVFFLSLLFALPTLVLAEQACDTSRNARSLDSDRFTEEEAGTLTDSGSDLMWRRCALGQTWNGARCEGSPVRLDWAGAQAAVAEINQSGDLFYNDWRVPSIRDLASIVERQCQNPRTSLELFPGTPADFFWTSTRAPQHGQPADAAAEDAEAYALSFGPEGAQRQPLTSAHHLRLVRSAL